MEGYWPKMSFSLVIICRCKLLLFVSYISLTPKLWKKKKMSILIFWSFNSKYKGRLKRVFTIYCIKCTWKTANGKNSLHSLRTVQQLRPDWHTYKHISYSLDCMIVISIFKPVWLEALERCKLEQYTLLAGGRPTYSCYISRHQKTKTPHKP